MDDEAVRKIVAGVVATLSKDKGDKNKSRPRQPLAQQNRQQEKESWEFTINWSDLYNINSSIKPRLLKGKPLKKKHKLEVVKRLVTQVRNTVPHATRDIFRDVMKAMKHKYPVSFSNELAVGKLPPKSLCKRMQDKFDNEKRPKRRTTIETEAPAIKAAYGCTKWRLRSLPDGETRQSLEAIQQEMAQHFEDTRPSRWDWEEIQKGMEKTYYLQRSEINKQAEQIEEVKKREKERKAKQARNKRRGKNKENENSRVEEEEADDVEPLGITPTEDIRERWPFLFEARGMLQHFKILTGVDLKAKFQAFLGKAGAEDNPGQDGHGAGPAAEPAEGEQALGEEVAEGEVALADEAADAVPPNWKADQLRLFLSATNKEGKPKKIKKKLEMALKDQPRDCAELTATVILLLSRFEEVRGSLWFVVDPDHNEETILEEIDIPKTPRLVIAGKDIFNPTTIFFTQDCSILGTASNFVEGLCMLFASYFVFNLEYDPNGQTTLEYLQRHVAGINPVKGHKRPAKDAGGKFSSYIHHHQISKLLTACTEYFAELESSEQSSGSSDQV